MKLKGLAKLKKDIESTMQSVSRKVDNVDWEKSSAEDLDNRLNDVWTALDSALEEIKSIEDI